MVKYKGDNMNIIILGAGKVGEAIAKDLSEEDHDITLIEQDEKRFESMMNQYDIKGIVGNGGSYEILKEAEIDQADVFLAVTENDELNMIASVLAKKMGAKETVARVRNPEYANLSGLMSSSLGITNIINPELQAAQSCMQLIEFPMADSFESFSNDKAAIVEMDVSKDFPILNKNLIEFRQRYNNIIVCFTQQNGEYFIPKGDHIIRETDELFVTGPFSELIRLYKDNGQSNDKIKSILIIGGGLVAEYVIKLFKHSNVKIKLIEVDEIRAQQLSVEYPHVEVINEDGTSITVLEEQGARHYDALLALTGIDEENIIVSMVAEKLGIKKRLTKINRTELLKIVSTVGLQSIITPKRITADHIVQYVRALGNSQGSNVEALYKIADDKIEALQFVVKEGSKACQKTLKDTQFIDNVLIAYIYRNGEVLFPAGSDKMMPNDRVIVIATGQMHLKDLDEIII